MSSSQAFSASGVLASCRSMKTHQQPCSPSPSRRHASLWRRALLPCLALLLPIPVLAQTTDDKDAQIAALKAEIEQLKAAARQQSAAAPAAAPAETSTTSATAAPAETASTGTAASAEPEDNTLLHLSKFEVRTTQGVGYSQGNSASALKTSEPLMKLP